MRVERHREHTLSVTVLSGFEITCFVSCIRRTREFLVVKNHDYLETIYIRDLPPKQYQASPSGTHPSQVADPGKPFDSDQTRNESGGVCATADL